MSAAIEPRPFASLSSSLLARKGHAKPAMRPQGFGFGMTPSALHNDDLGWNDMGIDQPAPVPVAVVEPVPAPRVADIVPIVAEAVPVEVAPMADAVEAPVPQVVLQRDALERELTPAPQPMRVPAKTPRAAPGSKGKAAFTLRLDPERHLKLRLVSAVNHRSAQAMVIAALDAFLDQQPAIAELARTKRQG